jgi:cytochrome P450
MHNESNVMMKKHIKNHQKEYNEGDSNDYLNAFLSEQKTRKKNKNFAEFFDDDTLIANMKILFVAGMETTTNTLRWALVYLMIHPDIQRKVQKEIDDVIGPNRMPSYEDRPRMPYTEAVLLEVQRCASVVPLSVIHRATDNAVLNGYKIPKDTLVLPNLYAVHHDEKLYPDPNSFRPERFINEQGQVIKPDWLIPFSVGKRFCLGEPLARMELFLYFTCMFQRFTFQKPEDATLSLKPIVTVVRNVGDFKSHILVRNK